MKKKLLALKLIFFVFFLYSAQSWADIHTSITSGNWNSTSTWDKGTVPASGDNVIINSGDTITVTANAAVNKIIFEDISSSVSGLIVNTGVTLTISHELLFENAPNYSTYGFIRGAGTINCEWMQVGGVYNNITSNEVTILTSEVAYLFITGNLSIQGEYKASSSTTNDATFLISEGVVSVGGTVECQEPTNSFCFLRMDQGSSQTGTLILHGAVPFTNTIGELEVYANGTNASVFYDSANQTIKPITYKHLATREGGTKTISLGFSVTGNLTVGAATTLTLSNTSPLAIPVNGNVVVNGTFNVANLTGANTHTMNIGGNLTNSGSFHMNNGDDVCNVTLNGSTLQTISGTATPVFNNLDLNNSSGCTLSGVNANVEGTLTFTSGKINTGSTDTLIISNNSTSSISGASSGGYVNGNLRRSINSGINTYLYPIGSTSAYTPVSIAFAAGTTAGFLTGSTTNSDHPNIATSNIGASKTVNRYWKLNVYSGLSTANYGATFTWVSADEDVLFDYSTAFCGKYTGSTWLYPTMGTRTTTSAEITGATSFSDFQFGNCSGEIDVKGNNISIVDGDVTPITGDNTDFGNQLVCSGSLNNTFKLFNTGTTALTIASVNFSGTNAADFSLVSPVSGTLAGGDSISMTINFNPSATGLRTATVTINNDDCDESIYDFALQGTGTDPEVNVKGNSVSIADGDVTPTTADHTDFGNQSVCSGTVVRTFTIENTGNANLTLGTVTISGTHAADFSVTSTPTSPVAASGSTTFQITFNPSASGLRSADISFTTNDCDEGTYNFSIEGTGGDPEVNVAGNSVTIADGDVTPSTADHTDFGNQSVCSDTFVRTFTIENNGNTNLTLGIISITGAQAGDFNVTSSPSSTVSASGSTTFQVTFNPSASGLRSADISFTTNDCDEGTYNFSIQGTGIDPEINITGNSVTIADGDVTPSTADHTDFGNQSVCSGTVVRTFTIQNTGTSNLTLTSIIITGANSGDYSITGFATSPVSASGNTTFQITFDPSAAGARTATVTIVNNDCDEGSYDFAIQGTGIDPEVNVKGNNTTIADGDVTPGTADHTDFGNQSVCSGSVVRTFTIENTGNSNLTLGTVTLSGTDAADYSITSAPTSPVAASGSTTFQVTFNPSASGLRSADISFTTNDCDEATYNFSIEGTGVDPEVNVTGNSVSIADGDITPSTTDHTDFGNQNVCSGTVVRTFTIENTGSANLTISSLAITGAASSDYSITSSPSSPISVEGSTTFQITFNPSAVGARNATITVNNNDCDEGSYDFSITGSGTGSEINVQGNSTTIVDGDLTPSTVDHTDFGSQNVSSGTIVRTFTIQNQGTATLNITGVNITGVAAADYSVTSSPSTSVLSLGSTTFQVTFDPSATGARDATITISNDDCDEGSYDFAITGQGIFREINVKGNNTSIVDGDLTPSLSDHTSFGDIAPLATLIRTYTIENTGNTSLTVSGITISGTHSLLFTLGGISFPTIIEAENSATFTITFTPTSSGLKTATVTITNNDVDEGIYDFAIQGERNCFTNLITASPTNDGLYTGGVSTNLYIGYGAQKDTLKAIGFGANVNWSPGTYLSCTSGCAKTIFTATTPGVFTYTASNGCISNTITITVKDVRHSGTGTSAAKVYLCHKEPVYNTIRTLVVLVRQVSSHFQYHPGDYLSSCAPLGKRSDQYSELVIDENELEVICTPNPFHNAFTLSYNSTSEMDANILIYSMTGVLAEKTTISGLSNQVMLGSNLPDGIYTVSFIQGDKKRVFRMIKVN